MTVRESPGVTDIRQYVNPPLPPVPPTEFCTSDPPPPPPAPHNLIESVVTPAGTVYVLEPGDFSTVVGLIIDGTNTASAEEPARKQMRDTVGIKNTN
jgi:hypothetical protein